LVQAFLRKWWVESDFKAPNLPLSLRLKVSGCNYNSIYNNTAVMKAISDYALLAVVVESGVKHHQTKQNINNNRFLQ
jgi:outer membrane cobalamin receptor